MLTIHISMDRFDVLTDANLSNQKRVLEMLKESKVSAVSGCVVGCR